MMLQKVSKRLRKSQRSHVSVNLALNAGRKLTTEGLRMTGILMGDVIEAAISSDIAFGTILVLLIRIYHI